MSGTVDSRIVTMKFDNGQFESGVKTSMGLLDKLKAALNFSSSKKGMDELQASAGRFNLGPMGASVEGISAKFMALSTIAITALSNITNKAVDAGIRIVKSLSLEQVQAGFQEYELKMGSIQTILSNTSKAGTTLDEVTASLDSLNKYADKTIYNFGDMTKNIGLFTNAGIGIKDATSMIKGFSNEAAASGTSSQGAAGAAYQLSQALSAGTIRLMDWRSLTNVGMGNKNMQNGLIEIADAMGAFSGKGITATQVGKDFNASLENNWLSAEVMTNYLKIQAGELSDEQMKSLGLTNEQIVAFKKQAQIAEDAATKVRTWTQLVGTIKESIGSGWSETFDIIIGDFNEATDLWTSVNDTLGGMIGAFGDNRNKMLQEWKDLGGRSELIAGLSSAFESLMNIIKPIAAAFREIFPAKTGKDLYHMTVGFRSLMESLKIGGNTINNIKRTFKGLFAAMDLGLMIARDIGRVFLSLFSSIFSGSGSILNFTGNLGDFIVKIRDAYASSKGIMMFFGKLEVGVEKAVTAIKNFLGVIGSIFSGAFSAGADAAGDAFDRFGERVKPVTGILGMFKRGWEAASRVFDNVVKKMTPGIQRIIDEIKNFGKAVGDALGKGSFEGVLDLINTGLLGGILLLVKRFFSGGISLDVGGKFLNTINKTFKQLTGNLKAMQRDVQANTLLKIAGAVALLTTSVVALSLIDSDKLTKALTALAVGMAQLMGAMAILTKISGMGGFLKIPFIAAGMVLLATAVLILTAAVKNLSSLSWEELGKGLAGVGALLAMVSAAVIPLSKNSGGMMTTGAGLILVSIALKILASVVKDFAELSWDDMGRGMAGLAGALLIIAAATNMMPPHMLLMGAGLILLGVGLKIIANVVKDFGGISWDVMGKGMAGMAGALLIIAAAMNLMPPHLLLQAAGLVVVGVALQMIGKVMKSMGGMSWEEIGKGMVVLAGSLLILGLALYGMTGSLPGAAALIVAAAALAILTPVLTTLGKMKWEEIGKGLAALAGVLLILGIAGALMTPVIPTLIGLGVAIALIGAGVALAGAGLLAFSIALGALAGSVGVAAAVISALLKAVLDLIPYAMEALGRGIIALAEVISTGGPAFVKAFVTILESLLDAVIQVTPKIGEAMRALITEGLKVLTDSIPKMAKAGLDILLGIIRGIRDNIYQIVTVASDIIVRFLRALGDSSGNIINAGYRMIIDMINGLTRAINKNAGPLRDSGWNLAMAIINGMTGGLASNAWKVVNEAWRVARNAVTAAFNALRSNSPSKEFMDLGKYADEGFALGFSKNAKMVTRASSAVAISAIDTVKSTLSRLSDVVDSNMDVNPVITPVINLDQFRKDATVMNGLIPTPSITAEASYGQASSISTEQQTAKDAMASSIADSSKPSVIVNYEQHNTSPESLSTTEIYRQTKNQLSQVKAALDVAS